RKKGSNGNHLALREVAPFDLLAAGGTLSRGLSIFEKPRAQATSSKFQTPKKHQAPSSKTDPRAVCPGIICFWVQCLRFGTSLELGVWCLMFRSAAAQKLRHAPLSRPRTGRSNTIGSRGRQRSHFPLSGWPAAFMTGSSGERGRKGPANEPGPGSGGRTH